MSKLVPIKLDVGSVLVSDCKVERILEYMRIFKEYPEVLRVILFGSCLETRCTENSDVDLWILLNSEDDNVYYSLLDKIWKEHDWTTSDDLLGCGVKWFLSDSFGALRDVKRKGVVIYSKQS